MSRTSPTQRSLALLRKGGWTAGVVERFNSHVGPFGIRQDFCGGIDLIAFRAQPQAAFIVKGDIGDLPATLGPGRIYSGPAPEIRARGSIVGVQCCSGSGALAKHKAKLLAEPRMREWVAAGASLVIHSWRKVNERKAGKRKLWSVDEVELRLEDFESIDAAREPQGLSA